MAVLRINRAKARIASGLNDRLNYMALYRTAASFEVGDPLALNELTDKSDGTPHFVELNKVEGLDKYKVVNDFSKIMYDWQNGTVGGLNRIMNFFIDHRYSASKIAITDAINGNVMAIVKFPVIIPTNGEDENFLINLFEILID